MTNDRKLAGYVLWALFWCLVAYPLFQYVTMLLINLHLKMDETSARLIWSFMLDSSHPAYMASVGFIELLIGFIVLRQLQALGAAEDVLRQGQYGVASVLIAVVGIVYLPGILHAIVTFVSQTVMGSTEDLFREGAIREFPRAQLMGFFLAGVVIAPVIEEFLFRGVLVSSLQARGLGLAPVVLISSVSFALLHSQYTVTGTIMIGGIGAFLCMLRIWSGGLMLPIIGHFTNNLVALLVYLSDKTPQ